MLLKDHSPQLILEWDVEKNIGLDVNKMTDGSTRKVWWKDKHNHSWQQRIDARTRQAQGCPYCSGRLPISGTNDLETLNPDVANQWHPTKNGDSKPSHYLPNSHRRTWWLCAKGHEWETRISKRTHAGHNCPICSNQHNHPTFKGAYTNITSLEDTHPELLQEWNYQRNATVSPNECSYGTDKKVWWICTKKHEWEAYIYHRTAGQNCPTCMAKNMRSKGEQELHQWLTKTLPGLKIETTVRNLIKGRELDIVLPEKNIAIEFNGIYWHSEAGNKNRTYHYEKWKDCKEQGIQLIQIWEDDWRDREPIVKRLILTKLNESKTRTHHPRKGTVRTITSLESTLFLEQNHIQGSTDASTRLGLHIKDELVAVLLLKNEPGKEGKVLSIVRYATKDNVPGGFSKLIKHIERNYPNVETLTTFSDNTISNGNLYSNNGFEIAYMLPPDYMYVVKGRREHKFRYRLKRFRTDNTLKYETGLTEKELAILNRIPRIWDAGKTKWIRNLK